jgi:hypothetical protein
MQLESWCAPRPKGEVYFDEDAAGFSLMFAHAAQNKILLVLAFSSPHKTLFTTSS